MAHDDEKLREYAEHAAAVLNAAGFPRMPARVLLALSVADSGLTAAEIAERLDISAAAVSGAVRYLQTLAMVRRVSKPGSRRDVYDLPNNTWYAASMSETRIFDAMISLTEAVMPATGGTQTPVGARLDEMLGFFRFIRSRLPELLREWDAQRRGRHDLSSGSSPSPQSSPSP
ncbi:GbsR/MarR family transcriptional regulator [Rathayibacter sp. CAU 1779]